MIDFKTFDSREAAAFQLANDIEQLLAASIEFNSSANFMVSGGSSPLKVYEHLSKAKLDWARVHIVLSDERCVKTQSDQSNAKMISARLLQDQAAAASFYPLVSEQGRPLSVNEIDALSDQFSTPFTVSLLGMGEDGHTASLFPDAVEIDEAIIGDDFYYQLSPDHLKQKRVSLSASVLVNSSRIILLIFGERKKQLFELASTPGDALDLPVRVLLQQQNVPVDVYWAP